jgi:aldehyde dehydrogenase (NAD+)
MVTQYKNLINGKMVDTGEWLDVVNPANEQVIGQVPACGADELDQAVAAARAAFKSWRKTSFEERQAACMAISGAIKANAEELYRLLTSEQGKPHEQAKGEIYGAAGMSAGAIQRLGRCPGTLFCSSTRPRVSRWLSKPVLPSGR